MPAALSSDLTAFLGAIDREHPIEGSVVRRYRRWVLPQGLSEGDLLEASIGEGMRRLPPIEHRGVEITLIDETSGMASGTFKSVEACVTAAFARRGGGGPVVCASGGNTGAALALYAARLKLPLILVVPAGGPRPAGAAVVAVKDASRLRATAERLSRRFGGRLAPELSWRYAAGAFRGCALAEWAQEAAPDWLSQTISAAFGPIGAYRALEPLLTRPPRFLAVQQRENSPFHDRWKGQSAAPAAPLLIPQMYDRAPFHYGSYDDFRRLMEKGGSCTTVSRDQFGRWMEALPSPVEARLGQAGIDARSPAAVAALVGLAGVWEAIDAGLIGRGQRIWHSMTAGAERPPQDVPAPVLLVENDDDPALAGARIL